MSEMRGRGGEEGMMRFSGDGESWSVSSGARIVALAAL
jgi:hypothetical protein